MSEVEKLYENVGIKLGCCKYAEYGYEGEEGTWYYCKKEGKECWTYPNGNANCVEKGYLPFTAEKQIKLIKWLSDFTDFGTFSIDHDKSEYGIAFCVHDDGYYFVDKIFEECIAKSIKYLWQSLTEEEKQQVKGILE